MSSGNIDLSYDWQEIEEHTLTLRGVAGTSSVTFVARHVLSRPDMMHTPDAIDFDTTLCIHQWEPSEPIRVRRGHAMYASLWAARDELESLRSGAAVEVQLDLVGLELRLYQHSRGARSGLCVEGISSSVIDARWWPWCKRGRAIGDWLLDDNDFAYCLRFAFLTTLIHPPYVDDFIRDINALLAYLEGLGPA